MKSKDVDVWLICIDVRSHLSVPDTIYNMPALCLVSYIRYYLHLFYVLIPGSLI